MSYCTQGDIIASISEATLIQLTDDASMGNVNESLVTSAIERASAKMDGILNVRYPNTPLETTPELTECCCDIAVRYLFKRRQGGVTENVKDNYNEAMSWLSRVKNRNANIVGINDQTGTQDSPGTMRVAQGTSKNFNWSAY